MAVEEKEKTVLARMGVWGVLLSAGPHSHPVFFSVPQQCFFFLYQSLHVLYSLCVTLAKMMVKALLCGLMAMLPATLGFVVPTASSSAFARGSRVAHVSATSVATSRPTMGMERSYIMIKPDGVQRG